jgi:hypothetical protein
MTGTEILRSPINNWLSGNSRAAVSTVKTDGFALDVNAVWIECFSCQHGDNDMLRDSAYYLSAIFSLAIMLSWLRFLTLTMQASGPF